MQVQVRRPVLLLAGVLLAATATAIAAAPVTKAHAACREHRDYLVHEDPLRAAVRPADCATLLDGPPEFTWPLQRGRHTYTVALSFPDGHVEKRSTAHNWLAWDHPVPAGDYTWRVTVAGRERGASEPRAFRIEPAADAGKPRDPAASPPANVASAKRPPAASPLFRVEPSESWIPAPKRARAPRRASVGGFFGGFTQ
ncbi:MAG TPA: hypothetical protein VLS49_01280 [Usitatibacter sp.]|nr:hypothetical protein [Usitatibacter sp.]